jgi:tetratricopeptide (TPR) repeat protein
MALAADQAALAAILADAGRSAEAEAKYLSALRVFRRRLGSRHYETGATLANLGAVYSKMGKLDDAENALRHGVTILEGALGRNHPRIAGALNNLAVVCARRGKTREAAALYQRVLRILPRGSRSSIPSRAVVRANYEKLLAIKR